MIKQRFASMHSAVQGYPTALASAPLTQASVTYVYCARRSQRRQHARQNLQPQVFFVVQSVCAPLDDADLVVQAFDEGQRYLVLWPAVGGDSDPVSIDHAGELHLRFEPLPLQARAPVLEEPAHPALALVVPELAEGLAGRSVREAELGQGRDARFGRDRGSPAEAMSKGSQPRREPPT